MANNTNQSQLSKNELFSDWESTIEYKKKYDQRYKEIMKYLSLDLLKSMSDSEFIQFSRGLVNFFSKDLLTRSEKLLLLNGLEYSFFNKMMEIGLYNECKDLIVYLPSNELSKFSQLIFNLAKNNNYNGLEFLFTSFANKNFNNSQFLRIIFMAGCRNLEVYDKFISIGNLNINDVGMLYNSNAISSLSQMICGSFDNLEFTKSFIDKFSSIIQINNPFITKDGSQISSIGMIIKNQSTSIDDKLSRLELLIGHNLVDQNMLVEVVDFILNPKIFMKAIEKSLLNSLFASQIFNSTKNMKYRVLEQLIILDFDENIVNFRNHNSKRNDPIYSSIELLNKLSSEFLECNYLELVYRWLSESENKKYNIGLLEMLLCCCEPEQIKTINTSQNLPQDIEQLMLNKGATSSSKSIKFMIGNVISNIKPIYSKKESEESLLVNNGLVENSSKNEKIFLSLINRVSEPKVIELLKQIEENIQQFIDLTIDTKKELSLTDDTLMKVEAPKKIKELIEIYLDDKSTVAINKQTENLSILISKLKEYNATTFKILDKTILESIC